MRRVLTSPSAVDPLINFGLPCTVRLPGGLPGFLLPVSLDASWPDPCKGWTVGPSQRAAGILSAVGCCSGLCKVAGQECAWVYWIKTALEKVVWERSCIIVL
ncbi:hypothetical protein HID58_078650 [Brassica napus]|uniref:Uncharacterized protein n=1 Tax=Brassica napus TaxID=3708 RepID=A0ABQ7YUL9_BRANA|nr:hypothetical protein HID58_078650 [Brassica napus]